MAHLIIVLAASILFFGFILLTMYEAEKGIRFFAASRYRLDKKVSRAFFVIQHVDWGAFTAHLTRTSLEVIAHDIAHGTLMAVRAVERFLTRTVRLLRMRRDGTLPPRNPDANRLEGTVTRVKQSLTKSRSPQRTMDIPLGKDTKDSV